MDDKNSDDLTFEQFIGQMKLRYFPEERSILRDAIFAAAREGNARVLDWELETWQKMCAGISLLQPPDEIRKLLCLTLDDGTTLRQVVEQQNNPDMLEVIAAFEAGRTLVPMERWCEDKGIPIDWLRPRSRLFDF